MNFREEKNLQEIDGAVEQVGHCGLKLTDATWSRTLLTV